MPRLWLSEAFKGDRVKKAQLLPPIEIAARHGRIGRCELIYAGSVVMISPASRITCVVALRSAVGRERSSTSTTLACIRSIKRDFRIESDPDLVR